MPALVDNGMDALNWPYDIAALPPMGRAMYYAVLFITTYTVIIGYLTMVTP